MATPGWLKYALSNEESEEDSAVPQLLLTNLAPRATAWFSAAPKSAMLAEVASTSRMCAFGAMAETMSRPSDIPPPQPALPGGLPMATLRKQPFAVVHAGSPYWARYAARSLSAFGSS